jgi:hypothetical protein
MRIEAISLRNSLLVAISIHAPSVPGWPRSLVVARFAGAHAIVGIRRKIERNCVSNALFHAPPLNMKLV